MYKKMCYAPFQSLEIYIGANSALSGFACCPNWCNFYDFGNLKFDDLNDMWNSEKAQNLRKNFLNNDYSICDNNVCPYILNKNFEAKMDENLQCEPIMLTSPLNIKLSYDSDCNIACNFCRENVRRNTQEQNEEYDKLIDKIIPFIKDTKTIALNGVGEPLASEHCKKLIKTIATTYNHIEFDLLTNGTLCNKKMFEELNLINRIKILRLSLNAACTETYNKVVPNFGFWFERIIENIEFLSAMKKQKDFAFHLQMVVTADNFRDIPNFIKLAKKYNAFASMWQFYPNICANSSDLIKRIDVFNQNHPDHKELINVLKQDILSESHVILSPLMQTIRNNSDKIKHFDYK